MSIQPAQAYNYVNRLTGTAASRAAGADAGGGGTATVGRPAEADNRTVALSEQGRALAGSDQVYPMDTGSGMKNLDLASYFASDGGGGLFSLDGLLLPTARNVQALQAHISSLFGDFLAANGIPEAPAKISYDSAGSLVLPADYPYADPLRAALEAEPALARELSTANALASHLAGFQATEPFHQEYAQARNQAEIDAVIEKYSYLFGANRSYPEIALLFSAEGQLTITADSRALV